MHYGSIYCKNARLQDCKKMGTGSTRWHKLLAMPRAGRPNVIYGPCGCFATTKGMLPYRGREASGRRTRSIGTRDGKHLNGTHTC